jgi:hypothetical protein
MNSSFNAKWTQNTDRYFNHAPRIIWVQLPPTNVHVTLPYTLWLHAQCCRMFLPSLFVWQLHKLQHFCLLKTKRTVTSMAGILVSHVNISLFWYVMSRNSKDMYQLYRRNFYVCYQVRKIHVTKLNSVASVRKRTIPTERPPHVGQISANFCG